MKNTVIKQTIIAAVAIMVQMTMIEKSFSAGTSSGQFLKLGAGAKAAAMGDTFTSIADDVTAAYWNPAGLSQLKNPEISAMHTAWIEGTKYQYFGGALPVAKNTFAVSLYRLDYGSIEGYDSTNKKISDFKAGSSALTLSYAREIFEGLMVGINGKYISESIADKKASTFAGDLGGLYKVDRYKIGLSLLHLGGGLKFVQESASLPQTIRLGASTKFLDDKLETGLEYSKPQDNDCTIHAGVDYQLTQSFSLRGGFQTTPGNQLDVNGLKGVSAGFGLKINAFSLDYAFVPFGDLASTHKVSLNVKFK